MGVFSRWYCDQCHVTFGGPVAYESHPCRRGKPTPSVTGRRLKDPAVPYVLTTHDRALLRVLNIQADEGHE